MKMIIASNNVNKVREIREIFNDLDFDIVSLKDEGIFINVVENGKTIHENSYKKAREIYEYLLRVGYKNFCVLSDDSGLIIDSLSGLPGVMSARFFGDNATDDENNNKVLKLMENIDDPHRTSSFLTVLTLILESGEEKQFEGELKGSILKEKRGKNGFGYDPIFYVDVFRKTLGEVSCEDKNSISHRYIALNKVRKYLIKYSLKKH